MEAGEDLSAGLHKFLIVNSSGKVIVNTTAQGPVNGICGMNAASGAMTIMVKPDGSKAKVKAGGSITNGAKVASHTDGTAIAWVDAVGNNAVGTALEGAAANDIITIQFGLVDVGGGS